jgi:GT2 family glycosyltransferase/SAM-dependent methyltransferase
MPKTKEGSAEQPTELYDANYYASHCGPVPYDRSSDVWAALFGNMADELIRMFQPVRVFDAGCAHGFLVEAFWDRGVEAFGRDISEFAISQVRADVKQYCSVGNLTETIPGRFDLVVCIEVLEHMSEEDGIKAIANMTAVTDRIIFSSSPTDLTEPTHVNVKPTIYWLRLFAAQHFAPAPEVALSIAPHALAFSRTDIAPREQDLIVCAELIRARLQLAERANTIRLLSATVAERDRSAAAELEERSLQTTTGSAVADLEQVVAGLHRQIEEHDASAAAQARAGMQARIGEQDQIIDQLTKSLSEQTLELEQVNIALQNGISERDQLVDLLHLVETSVNTLSDRSNEIAEIARMLFIARNQVAERDQQLLMARDSEAAKGDLATDRLEGQVDELLRVATENAELRDRTQAQSEELVRAKAQLKQLDQAIEQQAGLRAEIEGITQSRTWRTIHALGSFGLKLGGAPMLRLSNALRSYRTPRENGLTDTAHQESASSIQPSTPVAGFDREFYLRTYKDVAAAGMDPLQHYLSYGRAEGRYANAAEGSGLRLDDLCNPFRNEPNATVSDEAFFISVITPTYNTEPRYIRELFQSLTNQIYKNWEWIVVDDGSSRSGTIATLRSIANTDSRVRLFINPTNTGISGASNAALAAAQGTYAALIDHDDLISRDAFLAVYEAWKCAPTAQLFFTDECKLQHDGSITDVWLKPVWSPAYLENTMCLGHLSVYNTDFLRKLGGFRSEYDGTQDYDLALRASLSEPSVVHVPIIGYVWRAIPGSAAAALNEKFYAIERQKLALLAYARVKHAEAAVIPGFSPGYWRIRYPLPSPAPLLSFVIPAGGGSRVVRGARIDLVINCVQSFEEREFYPNREYIIVHGGNLSTEQIVALEKIPRVKLVLHGALKFNFSETMNVGVAAASGDYICLLNDDIEAITHRGGEELVSYLAVNRRVGAIGPKCLLEDDSIQQNGVLLLDAGPAHAGSGMPRDFRGHYSMLRCRREAFCLGAAMFVIRKEVYQSVGGFAEDFPLNYNDVDFGLRLRARGYSCVVDPAIEVYHYESATKAGTYAIEQERLFLKHPKLNDPYFNRNFDQSSQNYRLGLENRNARLPFGSWLDRHIAKRAETFVTRGCTKFSVCVLVRDQSKRVLEEMYQSVMMQSYENRELVILDCGSSKPETLQWLATASRVGKGIVMDVGAANDGAGRISSLLGAMTGAFFVTVRAQDFLSVDALQVLAYEIERAPGKKIFYADEYSSDLTSFRSMPFFKPDFDPVLFVNFCYTGNLLAIEADFLRKTGFETADSAMELDNYDGLTWALAAGEEPVHVRELLYGRRIAGGDVGTLGKPENIETQRSMLSDFLDLRGLGGSVSIARNTMAASLIRWKLQALKPVAQVRVLQASDVWKTGGLGIDGLISAANEVGIEWIAIVLSEDQQHALLELSAVAHFDPRINAVCGVLIDDKRNVQWSGGLFIPDGGLFDPYFDQPFSGGGYFSTLWCQRCIDVAAPVNVLIRAPALLRAATRPGVKDADSLMVMLGLDAHERGEFIAITPHLEAVSPQSSLVLAPMDRAGLLKGAASIRMGSRWYDGRLEIEQPYTMPGQA